MNSTDRALVIGSAPPQYIEDCVSFASQKHERVVVLSKNDESEVFKKDNVQVQKFEGQLDICNKALIAALIKYRPSSVYIVYGSWLGHNKIFLAVHFMMSIICKRYDAYLFSRSAKKIDLKERISHPFTRVDLNITFLHLIALPLYLLIRIVAPVAIVRFEQIRPSALGHFEELEIYLGMKKEGKIPEKAVDIFCYKDKPCNNQILNMYRKKLNIIPLARYLLAWNYYFPGGEKHAIGLRPWDYTTLITQKTCSISFTEKEKEQAQQVLGDMGVAESDEYVCIGFRDGLFDKNVRPNLYRDNDHSSIRKQLDLHSFRNATIENALPAIKQLASKGYKVIRMGSIARPLPEEFSPYAYDYANSDSQNELMDIYLGGTCRFFITTGYGLDTPPLIFRRPMVSVNTEYRLLRPNILYIFRHHWSRTLKRNLTLREIFESGAAFYSTTTQFEENNIELHENSPQEILEVVQEMDARTKGEWVESQEDADMQKKFWDIARNYYHSQYSTDIYTSSIRIGSSFLKSSPDFLK